LERKARDSCRKSGLRETPQAKTALRRLPNRPRKASAWSNQQARLTAPNYYKVQANKQFKYSFKMGIIAKNPKEHVMVSKLLSSIKTSK
jgi:hypothetical protein